LFQLSNTPVSGAVAVLKNGSTIIRYTDRATGHIIDVNPETMEKVKISNNTLPKIYEAYYKKDGSGVVYRSLKDDGSIVNTSISLTAPKSTSTGETLYTINASMLRGDVGEIAVLPSGNLVYSTNNPGAIISSGFAGDKPTNIYTTPFTEWRISPSGPSDVYITTKAGGDASGYSYKISTKTGGLTKILGPLNSLLVLPNQNKTVVAYSYKNGNSFSFGSLNTTTKKSSSLTPSALVEKCVWSNKSVDLLYCGVSDQISYSEPDNWYKGVTHFSDRIWAYNTNTTFTDVIAEPKNTLGVDIDVYNPSLSPDEDYLIFMNRNDLSLWALKLN
ncbi:MAG: hypothetical protein WA048_01630, partial [Minisyncoccia bacterium]